MSYVVTVDYNMPLIEMIGAGKFVFVDEKIYKADADNANFTAEPRLKKLRMELVHLEKKMSPAAVHTRLFILDLRPATTAELLAFGGKHPELQLEFPIVARGSRISSCVPCLFKVGRLARSLDLLWDDRNSHKDDRFLAVNR